MAHIRSMTAEDKQAVLDIYQSGIDTGIATFRTQLPDFEEWDSNHLPSCRLVAVENDKVIGWAALSSYSNMYAYRGVAEVSIYIDATYHGKGVGTTLLNELSDKAEQEGFWSLQSKIIKENAASIRLHVTCGYRIIGFHEKIAQDKQGIWHDTVLMEKNSVNL